MGLWLGSGSREAEGLQDWCPKYNYFVQYIEDDGTTTIYRHSLSAANYWDESQGSGIWLCLEPDFYSN